MLRQDRPILRSFELITTNYYQVFMDFHLYFPFYSLKTKNNEINENEK